MYAEHHPTEVVNKAFSTLLKITLPLRGIINFGLPPMVNIFLFHHFTFLKVKYFSLFQDHGNDYHLLVFLPFDLEPILP